MRHFVQIAISFAFDSSLLQKVIEGLIFFGFLAVFGWMLFPLTH
jgi:hypothetical protein